MSNTSDTAPAAEIELAETATSLTEALGGSERHQVQEIHEAEREVGAAPAAQPAATPAPVPAKTSAQPAPTAATPAPAPAGEAAPPAADEKQPKWYREHMAKTNRELAATRAENERLRSGRQPPPQQRQDQPSPEFPDPVDDPTGYHNAVMSTFERRQQAFELQQTLKSSERWARREHGSEAFEETQAWLSTKPELADWCVMQPDPWGAAFSHYQKEKLAEEIGDDPNAWREQERQRIRAELEAELSAGREERHTPARSMTPNRAPPPAPASTVRNAGGLERDGRGKFTGPTPMSAALRR